MRPCPVLLTALLVPLPLYGQSPAAIRAFIDAETIQVRTTADTTWRDIKLRVIDDCIWYLNATDDRSSTPNSFEQVTAIRLRKRGAEADTWADVSPVEIGAMRGCARRKAR